MKALIEKGANINALNYFKWGALHLAARYNNNADVVNALIEKGANIDALDVSS